MDRVQRRAVPPPTAPPLSGTPPAPPKTAPTGTPSLERGRPSLSGGQISLLKSLPRMPLLPASSSPPSLLARQPALPDAALAPASKARSPGEIKAQIAEKERTFVLTEALLKAGFPGRVRLQDALPVRTAVVEGFLQQGVDGLYDDKKKQVRIHKEHEGLLLKVDSRDPHSYSRAAKAAGTFYHELIHHQQEKFIEEPWFKAMEKHYEEQLTKAKMAGKQPPQEDINGTSNARKYVFEAFPNYAESRAEQWMTTRATLALLVQYIKDPAELRAALQVQKEAYEASIQKKGQTFGYINEFPSPWDGKFPLPEGPLRRAIDEATGIPGSFDRAFPEFAAILRGES